MKQTYDDFQSVSTQTYIPKLAFLKHQTPDSGFCCESMSFFPECLPKRVLIVSSLNDAKNKPIGPWADSGTSPFSWLQTFRIANAFDPIAVAVVHINVMPSLKLCMLTPRSVNLQAGNGHLCTANEVHRALCDPHYRF